MSLFDIIFAGWFPMYVAFSYYKLNGLLRYTGMFYDNGAISHDEYNSLKRRYTGLLRFYARVPRQRDYPRLYWDGDFKRFCRRIKNLTWLFVITGVAVFLLMIFF